MLKRLHITSFRGIDSLDVVFGARTYIQGANGSGKTHILDAIHLLSGTHPLYGDHTLSSGTLFEGFFDKEGLQKSYRLYHDEKREFFSLQGAKMSRPKYMLALPWRTVYISPFDMNLLYFAPGMRRDTMDLVLARVYEQFPRVKKDYELVMRERNTLLKKIREGEATRDSLDFWDKKFAELAEVYLLYRRKYIEFIQASLIQYPVFFSHYPIQFVYDSSVDVYQKECGLSDARMSELILQYLSEKRERDILSGHTHIGPHRDDWGFKIVKNEILKMKSTEQEYSFAQDDVFAAESYLSRGEMKMLLLGLKMLEASFIEKILGLPIIILIDDIFAELDEKNSEAFLNSLKTHQIILTSQKPLPNHEKHSDFICINLQDS